MKLTNSAKKLMLTNNAARILLRITGSEEKSKEIVDEYRARGLDGYWRGVMHIIDIMNTEEIAKKVRVSLI